MYGCLLYVATVGEASFMEWIRRITLMTVQILVCSGIKIYYIVPNGTNTTNCPFQPCATLDYYLSNNISFSTVSDVQFHILVGEHILTSSLIITEVCNFTLLGITDSNSQKVILKLDLETSIIICNSNNVTFSNLLLIRHGANWKEDMVTLQIVFCISCKVKNITFDHPYGFGMILVNMMGTSHVENIKLYIHYNSLTQISCSQAIFVRYEDNDTLNIEPHLYNIIYLNNITVKGKISDKVAACPTCSFSTMFIFELSFEHTQYSVTLMVKQAMIRNIIASCRPIIVLQAYPNTFYHNFVHFENLTFHKNTLGYDYIAVNSAAIVISISNMHISVCFVNSTFSSNFLHYLKRTPDIISAPLISITIDGIQCQTIVIIDNSLFKWNKGQLLNAMIINGLEDGISTPAFIILTGNTNILNNKCFSKNLISIQRVNTIFNGTVSFINNTVISSSIVLINSCKLFFIA